MEQLIINQVNLVGLSVKHTLEEDHEHKLIENLIEKIKKSSTSDSYYLVQIYDDFYEETQEIITFIGSETASNKAFYSLKIPKNDYLIVETIEETIDETYTETYKYFETEKISIKSNYDFELLNINTNRIQLHFPLNDNFILLPNYYTVAKFLAEIKDEN